MTVLQIVSILVTIIVGILWVHFGLMRLHAPTYDNHVVGKVERGAALNYGGHRTAVCSYVVNGKRYEVVGPKFLTGSVASGARSNLTDRKHLPMNVVGPLRHYDRSQNDFDDNTVGPYEISVIAELYPIGSDVDIYYDANDPSKAYVERPVATGVFWSIFIGGWFFTCIFADVIFFVFGL